jgi:hypothetical protein
MMHTHNQGKTGMHAPSCHHHMKISTRQGMHAHPPFYGCVDRGADDGEENLHASWLADFPFLLCSYYFSLSEKPLLLFQSCHPCDFLIIQILDQFWYHNYGTLCFFLVIGYSLIIII